MITGIQYTVQKQIDEIQLTYCKLTVNLLTNTHFRMYEGIAKDL